MSNIANLPYGNFLFLTALNSLCACAVNCFFLITGWFCAKKNNVNIRKPVHILFVFCAYKFLTYNLSVLLGFKAFDSVRFLGSFLPNSYFALMYASVLMLSPFVNLLISKLRFSDFRKLIVLLCCLFSLYPSAADFLCARLGIGYMGMSNISIHGNDWGYTFVNFMFLYLLGAFLRLAKENNSIVIFHQKRMNLFIYLLASALIFLSTFVNPHATNYCNPFVILQSIGIFLFFSNLSFHNDVINWMSQSVWGVYVIHMGILWFWSFFSIQQYVQKSILFVAGNVFVVTVSVFTFSVLLEKIYNLILFPVRKFANGIRLCNINIEVDFNV